MTRPNFIGGKATAVRLAPAVASALGLQPNADVELHAATVMGGWLQADYRNGDGSIDRYLLPPDAVLFVKQRQSEAERGTDAPPPERVPAERGQSRAPDDGVR